MTPSSTRGGLHSEPPDPWSDPGVRGSVGGTPYHLAGLLPDSFGRPAPHPGGMAVKDGRLSRNVADERTNETYGLVVLFLSWPP
jgi:hypothetical protein